MQPSEKYAVDYTDGLGLKWSKKLGQIYTSLGNVDLSAAISSFNDPLVKTVYRKSRTFNPIYDNAITYASVGHDSLVMKYFARNGYPADSITSGTVIVDHSSPDGLSYATGVNEDASAPYNGGLSDSRVLTDAEYNKMLFKVTLREITLNTSDTPIANTSYNDPTYTDVQLKDIDNNKWYGLFYHNGAKVWDGSSWSDASIAPVMICSGDSVQSFQGGGSSFNNLFNNYNGTMGSGQNIGFTNAASNYYWTAHNFVNRMNIENYSLGWSDSYDYKPSYADNFDAMKAFMLSYLTDNSYSPWQSVWFQLCREVHQISDDMSVLLTVHCYACLDGSNNLYINWDNIYTFPIIKGSSVSKFLAGHGLYYLADSSADLTGITPDTLHNSSAIWVGEMSADGTTTGNWIKGADIENYTGYNKDGNIVNPDFNPSGGGGDDGDDPSDDQASGGIYGGAQGMCNLYYMTTDEIKNLQNWFRGSTFPPGIQIPADFDPSNQLIGLMAFPVELGGSVDSTTITFRTADNQAVDTGVSCQKAYGDDLKFDLGTIDIPARMAQRGVPFLDYSCQVEVYIPFCDVVQLDVQQVIGTTLKCEMWISPATGDVSAMLSSGTHPVAYTSGNCAQQLPISVSSYGAIAGAKLAAQNRNTQAVFQAAQNVIKDITNAGAIGSAVSNHTAVNGQGLVEFSRIPQVQSNTGLAVGAGIKAAGTMVNTALQLTAQNFDNRYALQVAKNSAPTHISGSFGACTSWHFPNYCYVKITRPHFQKPDNYGHTEAVPVVATKPLSLLTGLTTCVNPDVSGIGTATMSELETIKSYLMSGVIL